MKWFICIEFGAILVSFFSIVATWFGLGKIKKAPGTFGTLGAIPLVWAISLLGPIYYMGFVLLFLPVSIIAAQVYENKKGGHDSKEIVVDEVIGFLITMTWLPMTLPSVFLGFLLFRFFDIVKPPPIGYLDRKVKGGFGVVVDDVVAGLISNLILQVIYTQTAWLGSQYILFEIH